MQRMYRHALLQGKFGQSSALWKLSLKYVLTDLLTSIFKLNTKVLLCDIHTLIHKSPTLRHIHASTTTLYRHLFPYYYDAIALLTFCLPHSLLQPIVTQLAFMLEHDRNHRLILMQYTNVLQTILDHFYPAIRGLRIALFGKVAQHGRRATYYIQFGDIPNQKFKANVVFAQDTSETCFGEEGVKMWVHYETRAQTSLMGGRFSQYSVFFHRYLPHGTVKV
jgi:hypothetical protein